MLQTWESNLLLLLGKIFFIVISVIYAVFSYIVVRQVNLMNKSFTTSLHSLFTFFAWGHFFVALLVCVLVTLLL